MSESARVLTERELFDRAMGLPEGADVDAFLKGACPDDAVLRRRVALLVKSSSLAADLLPDEPSGWSAEVGAIGEAPGQWIGHYRLEELIGQGGFGAVWLAWQHEPVRRKVAVKILKPGLDTSAVVARFAAERQVLAMMDHPNVAHVYDAGSTPAGRPYFVMEYLEGEPLFSYAAARKLTVAGRVKLMQQAASAVQHAHQKGIIHRDLKPSNIIVVEVDGSPVPKIIDFGIAKVVSAETGGDLTMAGQQWGTPAYMSPEQIAGEPLDTRTDVYSFGVILFELITGVRAVTRGAKPGAESLTPSRSVTGMGPDASRAAAAERATTPRELAGALRGELDWIVMKATAADPAQRYDSAGALRDDLQRFEAGQPVTAGPPGTWYRTGKFIRRHKVILAAAAAAVLALVAGTIVSLVYARRAHEATQVMSGALYDARITEARAVRQSGRPGQRTRALASIEAAAKLRPTPELRDEALAAMALPDVSPVASLDVIPETSPVIDYDFASDVLVVGRHDRVEILRYRLTTGEALGPMPPSLRLAGTYKLCLSPGAEFLAVYPIPLIDGLPFSGDLAFYETASGRKLCEVPDADFACDGCEFLAGGARAVIPMLDGGLSVVTIQTGREERRIQMTGRLNQVRANAAGTRLLACRSGTRSVSLIDAATGLEMYPLTAHAAGVVASFSPDGRLVALGDDSGTVLTTDLTTAADRAGMAFVDLTRHPGAVTSVDFVLGGQFVASAGWDHTVRLCSPGGQQMMIMEAGQVMAAPGGERLLVWQGKRVQLLDLIPPRECTVIPQTSAVDFGQVSFSPDKNFVAMRVSGGTLVSTWPDRRPMVRFEGAHKGIAFGPREPQFFTAGSRGLCTWDMAAVAVHGPVVTIPAESGSSIIAPGQWSNCAVSSDGRYIASVTGHDDELKKQIGVFSLPSRQSVASIQWTSPGVGTLVFDPLGRWLAASWWRGRGFTVWETATWKLAATCEREVGSLVLAVSDDGRHLASCSSSEFSLWQTNEWQPALRVPFEPVSAAPRQVALAPQGKLAAFESEPWRVRLVRPDTGDTVATLTLPLRDPVHHLAFSPDGNTLSVATPARTWFFDLPKMREHVEKLGLSFGP